MPIIKSAKKRASQALVRQARNYNTRTAVRKSIRAIADSVKAGDKENAEKGLAKAYRLIDTATKKNVLHKNTAARRKALVARLVAKVELKEAKEKKAK